VIINRTSSIFTALICIFIFFISSVQAIPVGPSDFGPSTITESFEGLSAASNIPAVGNGAFLKPGVLSAYTFASGITLTWPVPNSSDEGPMIGDFALGDASFALSSGGIGSSADVPFGTAYMVSGGATSNISVQFNFAGDMIRAGAYLGGNTDSVTVSFFDSADILLKQINLMGKPPGWETNFVAYEHTGGIRKLAFDYGPYSTGSSPQHMFIDKLMFEPIPEPTTAAMLALGGLAVFRKARAVQRRIEKI